MFCTRCGTKNPDNSANCYNCGHNMAKAPDRTLQTRSGSLAEVRPVAPPKEYGSVDVNGSAFAVTGIRFGVYKHYVNGIRTSQSYGIWVCDGNDQLQIECAAGFLVSNSKIE